MHFLIPRRFLRGLVRPQQQISVHCVSVDSFWLCIRGSCEVSCRSIIALRRCSTWENVAVTFPGSNFRKRGKYFLRSSKAAISESSQRRTRLSACSSVKDPYSSAYSLISAFLVSVIFLSSAEYCSYTGQNLIASVSVRVTFAAMACFFMESICLCGIC